MTWVLKLFLMVTGMILMPQAVTAPTPTIQPQQYQIQVQWYPLDSDATRIVNYRYSRNKDLDMISTFMCENGAFNILSRSPTNDAWLCQLHKNKTNSVWIYNPLRKVSREYQAQVCLDKRENVANKNIRSCYKIRQKFKHKILFIKQ